MCELNARKRQQKENYLFLKFIYCEISIEFTNLILIFLCLCVMVVSAKIELRITKNILLVSVVLFEPESG